MLSIDEDALICDLAETYHILDYKRLPASRVAVFSLGLSENSRIKRKISGQLASTETILMAGIYDIANYILWTKTNDGQKGINRPKPISDQFLPGEEKKESNNIGFSSGEEFEKARLRALGKEE